MHFSSHTESRSHESYSSRSLKTKRRTKRLERKESVVFGLVVGFFFESFSLLRSSRLLRSAFADVSKCDLRAMMFQRETNTTYERLFESARKISLSDFRVSLSPTKSFDHVLYLSRICVFCRCVLQNVRGEMTSENASNLLHFLRLLFVVKRALRERETAENKKSATSASPKSAKSIFTRTRLQIYL